MDTAGREPHQPCVDKSLTKVFDTVIEWVFTSILRALKKCLRQTKRKCRYSATLVKSVLNFFVVLLLLLQCIWWTHPRHITCNNSLWPPYQCSTTSVEDSWCTRARRVVVVSHVNPFHAYTQKRSVLCLFFKAWTGNKCSPLTNSIVLHLFRCM